MILVEKGTRLYGRLWSRGVNETPVSWGSSISRNPSSMAFNLSLNRTNGAGAFNRHDILMDVSARIVAMIVEERREDTLCSAHRLYK